MSKKFLTWLLACLCVTALSAGVACGGEDNSVSSSQESVASTDSSFIESSSSKEESSFIAENSSIEESSSVEEESSSIEEESSSIEEDSSSEIESIYSENDSSIEEDSSMEDNSSIEEENSSIEEDSSSEPAHVHSYWDQVIKTPGCVEAGEKKYTCACGENYIEEIPAKGHNYAFGDSQYIQESDQWIVSLKCDCGAWTVATGEFSHMVDATCRDSGYSVYVYSYDNGIGEIKTEEIHAFLTGKSNEHTITNGENTIQIKQGALVNYKDVKELINSRSIRWVEGEPRCNEVALAGADCSRCGNLFIFNVQKEHDFEYKTGSLNEETMTAIFACECRESIEVSVIEIDYIEGDCLLRPYYVYQTVGFSEEQVIHIYDYEAYRAAPHLLVLKAEEGKTHYAEFVDGEKYQYNDTIEAFMDAGLLLWTEIGPEHCNIYRIAGFTCERCNCLIVIHLSGKHVFNDEGRCESCGEEQKSLFE